MLADQAVDLIEKAAEAAPTLASISEQVAAQSDRIVWLYILVAIVGLFLAWSLHRLAKNQVQLADLLRRAARGETPSSRSDESQRE